MTLVSGVQHNLIFVYIAKQAQKGLLISVTTYSYNSFLLIRTFKIYFLSKFQVSSVLLTVVAMLYITSPGLNFFFLDLIFYKWKFVPFDSLHPFKYPTPPSPLVPTISEFSFGLYVCF